MSCRSRAVRPVLEGLEARILMYATTGNHFTYGSRITWSIEPDGTNLGGTYSNLVSTMDGKFGAGNWERAIQDAFAVWENVANINTVQVSDNGAGLDAGSYQQGSPNFGDIRIGGFAINPGVLGFTLLPPPSNGGSDSGDIILNTNQAWKMGNDYDLESVMIHEIGHALGMGHSADSTASMYAYYHGIQQYVNNDDVAGIDSIWSARQEDGFVIGNQNFVPAHAVNVTSSMGPTDQIILGPLDDAKGTESYWFKATTPANASNIFQAVVQSTYLSEFSPRVTVYDANLNGLAQVITPANTYGTIISGAIYNATPNTTYYVEVTSANAGPTATGAYALLINMGTQNLVPFSPPNTQVLNHPDQGGGSTLEKTNDPGSAGLPNGLGSGGSQATVAPMSISASGLGLLGRSDPLRNLSAWENIHSFSGVGQSGGGTPPVDISEVLTIGKNNYLGDFLLTTPAPTTNGPSGATQSVTASLFIPLDPTDGLSTPTTPSARKNSSVTLINVSHPTGPF
jgi:Matrixin